MDNQNTAKKATLKKYLNQLENSEQLKKDSKKQFIVLIMLSISTILVPISYFGFTAKTEYSMLLLVWISGASTTILITLKQSLDHWKFIQNYIDKEKIKSDLSLIK